MQFNQVMFLASMLLLSGCVSGKTIIQPINGTDFYRLTNGDYCMTPFYMNEVLQAKVQ